MAGILVIGLGNPLLGDDGVGWRVAAEVERLLAQSPSAAGPPAVEVDCLSLGGLSLMERMIGYRRVILVDALSSGAHPAGQVSWSPLEALPDRSAGHTTSAHDTSLQNALKVGREMGAALPARVDVVAVEAYNLYEFTEELTPAVAAAAPHAARLVLDLIANPEPGSLGGCSDDLS